MAPRTLAAHAQSLAIRNIRAIDDLGTDIPVARLEPILAKCPDQHKLRTWEQNSPYIIGKVGHHWERLIKRDFPAARADDVVMQPRNPHNWWKVYRHFEREQADVERVAEEALRKKMAAIKQKAESTRVAPPTQAIPERKARRAEPMQFQRGSNANGLNFNTGTKTKDAMTAIRRQTVETKLQRTGVLARPTHLLTGQVPVNAPVYMVMDRQRQAELERRRARIAKEEQRKSKAVSGYNGSVGGAAVTPVRPQPGNDIREREARLKAVKADPSRNTVQIPSPAAVPVKAPPTPPTPLQHRAKDPVTAAPSRPLDSAKPSVQPSSATKSLGPVSSPKAGSVRPPSSVGGLKRKPGPSILLPTKRPKR